MIFHISLANLIVYHEEFIGKDNQQLRLLLVQLEQNIYNHENQKLASVNFLHTSPENPLFLTSNYNEIENKAHVHFSKFVILQIEALLSILRFQDTLMKQLLQDILENQAKKKQKEQTNAKDNKNIDIKLENLSRKKGDQSIISQQDDNKELLHVDLFLFNCPKGYQKPINVFDCDIKVQFAKANFVFLFKYIHTILSFLDSLNITKPALNIVLTQVDVAYEQEQAFKVHLNITFNIIIPTNSYSDQVLFLI
ncbi:unnamed protein product [Rotaria sp. Silwood1]|nr:unnamed protein product [Rotaria sp. Silwood1]